MNDNKSKLELVLGVINNRITTNVIIYIVAVVMIINAYLVGNMSRIKNRPDKIIYLSDATENDQTVTSATSAVSSIDKSIIFGSSKGKYFYYKFCAPSNISPKNLVYYKSESDAISKGKILHKGCE